MTFGLLAIIVIVNALATIALWETPRVGREAQEKNL